MNLAFFGDVICGRRNSKPVSTFVDLILVHYGSDAVLVAKGVPNGISEQGILERIQTTPDIDIALVFHALSSEGALDEEQYLKAQLDIETVLRDRNIPTIHFIDPEQANMSFTWGLVDQEIMNYLKLTRVYRVSYPDYESSDNRIDYYGNMKAAGIIIEYIDQLRTQ
jgi:hypothetical protein